MQVLVYSRISLLFNKKLWHYKHLTQKTFSEPYSHNKQENKKIIDEADTPCEDIKAFWYVMAWPKTPQGQFEGTQKCMYTKKKRLSHEKNFGVNS